MQADAGWQSSARRRRLRWHQRAGRTSSTPEPDAEHVSLGMKVKLATYEVGTDSAGTRAIGFGFEPLN